MSTPNDLDERHIQMVADEALRHQPRGLARFAWCTGTDHGFDVRVRRADSLPAVREALRKFGYELGDTDADPAPDGRPLGVRVTGWSADGLRDRREALTATIERLTGALGSTVGDAAGAYQTTLAEGYDPLVARGRAKARIEAALKDAAARDTGPLGYRRLTPDDPGIAALVDHNDELCGRVQRLLNWHAQLAEHAIAWLADHRDSVPPDEARPRTVEAMRGRIAEAADTIRYTDVGDRFNDAWFWVHDHAADLALGFADWYTAAHPGPDAPPPHLAFEEWAANGLTDAAGVSALPGPPAPASTRAGRDATRPAATDFPEPPSPAPGDDPAATPPPQASPGHGQRRAAR